jgi:ADP-heptose:LPS heptosyltransferase
LADQLKVFGALGGGVGDLWWDWLHEPSFRKLASLVERNGARVRIYSQCHCAGAATDLFHGHPHVHEVVEEPWAPPTPELQHRWNTPTADGFIPLSRNDLLHDAGVRQLDLQQPQIHLLEGERHLLGQLLTRRPCVVAQPYAGLSDRDGFDVAAIARLAAALQHLAPAASLLVIGRNHDRGHKYTQELCPAAPNLTDLIDQLNIRVTYHLVANCDAFVGAHSNLIRAAWDHRRRTVLVVPEPLMTRHLPTLDSKYTYGLRHPENRVFTYPFDHGQERQFDQLDTSAIAEFLLRG